MSHSSGSGGKGYKSVLDELAEAEELDDEIKSLLKSRTLINLETKLFNKS